MNTSRTHFVTNTPPQNLSEWEAKLSPQVAVVDLLGEIPITQEECQQLGQSLGRFVKSRGWHRAEKLLRDTYPCSFAIYLVAQGRFGYDEGAFWPSVRETTGLNWWGPQKGGQLFEEILDQLAVAHFPALGGHRYLGPILAHGGIPDTSLDDFFEHFLRPLVERPRYAALSTLDFITERLHHSSAQYLSDKPVLRFLEHGGTVAEDFVERCRQMAIQAAETDIVPSAEVVGLPRLVINRYRNWLQNQAQRILPKRRGKYRRPILFLDPWGWGLTLQLLSQQIEISELHARILWRVFADDTLLQEILPDIRQEEFHLRTAPEYIPIPQVAAEYRVELIFHSEDNSEASEVKQIWHYPGLREQYPLITFDPDRQTLLPIINPLPARQFWILYPSNAELLNQGFEPIPIREYLPKLPWKWHTFQGVFVDLGQIQKLVLRRNGLEDVILDVEVLQERKQPCLIGSSLYPTSDDRAPLYITTAPQVWLPTLLDDAQLRRWYVTFDSEWMAFPELHTSGTLDTLTNELKAGENGVIWSLDTYLPQDAMGNYRVTVRGPLGQRADLPFRFLPKLDMANHDVLHLPNTQQDAYFLLETVPEVMVQCQPGAKDCTVQQDDAGFYEVSLSSNSTVGLLRFSRPNGEGDTARVPLSVPIRRLRWMVVLDPNMALAPAWRVGSDRIPLDALNQSQEPALFIDLFGGVCENLDVSLSLEDENENVLHPLEDLRYRQGQTYGRFDLRAFLDTMRHSNAPLFRFRLQIWGMPEQPETLSYIVLSVTRRFVVEQANTHLFAKENQLWLGWQSPVLLRQRFVRLWPAWRPWERPLEFSIPDEAQDEYRFSLPPGGLVHGKYLLEFGIQDPWVRVPLPAHPPSVELGVEPICIPHDAAFWRRKALTEIENNGQMSFEVAAERALIQEEMGNHAAAQRDLQWCYEYLGTTKIDVVLAFVHALTSREHPFAKRLRFGIAAPDNVQRAIRMYGTGELAEDVYREYLKQLPRMSLIHTPTCELLLEVDDRALRGHALQELLKRERGQGAKVLVQWVMDSKISEDDAVGLLVGVDSEQIPSVVIEALETALPKSSIIHLFERLGKLAPEQVPVIMVRPGYWVRTKAGWGLITHIENLAGQTVEQFYYKDRNYSLYVKLRASSEQSAEFVVVNLSEQTITFPKASVLFTCTKCRKFTTQHQNLITSTHNSIAHGGLGPALRQEPETVIKFYADPEFKFLPTMDIWG